MKYLKAFLSFLDALGKELHATLVPYQAPEVAPQPPVVPATPPLPPKPIDMPTIGVTDLYADWNTQKHAYHNVRVVCDRVGLTVDQKNILSACVWQESQFKNSALGKNRDKNGNVLSTDFGLFQVNDYYHIGKGKDFPSVEYVLANPEKVCTWMAKIMKTTGKLQPWVSYSSGAYKHWLINSSPMWLLKS